MTNMFKKFFLPEYQLQVLDTIKKYTIYCTGNNEFTISDKGVYISVVRMETTNSRHPILIRLYMNDFNNGSAIPIDTYEHNTEFANMVYNKMLNTYKKNNRRAR
ncbi:MAG: hypothetical protein IJX89_00460 [Alphaproteobacteria bacterium]|nr:hypothetical protein [Alphaproteobacteria bacterium]